MANIIDTRTVRVNGAIAIWTPISGAWSNNAISLNPGINRVLVQAFGTNGTEIDRITIDVWSDSHTPATVAGNIATDTIWAPSNGPYVVPASASVLAGATLQILPGTTVYFAAGASLTINGRLLAEGNDTNHIRFTRQPGGGNWASLDFINTTTESRLAYVDFEFAGGRTIGGHEAQVHANSARVFFDHLAFPSTPVIEYISFDGSSFIVQNSIFPSYPGPTGPEMLHGVNGIPAGGYGILRDNYFGHTWGFNDTIDFTGGNRPGPILQVINNIFDGASDDHLDLDSTDAWIEGNIFMHAHRDPTRTDNALDTASAISGGVDTLGQNSDWTVINNIFYDVDHVLLNKGNSTTTGNGGGRVAFLFNTVIHVAKEYSGSTAPEIAAFNWSDDNIALPDDSLGSGMYAAHNIIYDCAALHHLYDPAHHTVIMDNNILSVPWSGPGSGNQVIDPRLNLGALVGTLATNVTAAQLRQAAQLLPGSPATGAGFGGRNLGGFQPAGIVVSGEPNGVTTSTSATLTVGPGGTFNWGTTAPQRWGWTAFKWKLDNGAFSAEIPINNNSPFTNLPTIALSNLSNGPHTVYVVGKNDAPPGYYQDDPFVYPATAGLAGRVTASRTWTVDTTLSRVVLNEVLARNVSAVLNGEDFPDVVELYNPGNSSFNLSGAGLTDDPTAKFKFIFPQGTSIPAGGYLVVYGGNANGAPGIHFGFKLKAEGSGLFLYNSGGVQLDSIAFGLQLPDLSIGRTADGTWGLTRPTPGAANILRPVGSPQTLKINEWLADERSLFQDDFLELYNPDPAPVNLGGLYLTDAPQGAPKLNPIPALSFIAGSGYLAFIADGKPENGGDHVNFKLSPNQGQIALLSSNLEVIDCILFGVQSTDISEGRQPNGANQFAFFDQPTPGAANPGSAGSCTISNISFTWKYNRAGTDLGTAWRAPGYNDSSWSSGQALLGVEDCGCLPFPLTTIFPNYINTQIIYYFRTTFSVNTNLSGFNLTLSHVLDDGAVIYLDGPELTRIRMPGGTITATTLPTATVGNAVLETFTTTASLSAGAHTLAVEVHNSANPSSSDIVWGLAIDATRSVTNCIERNVVLNELMANNQSVTNSDGSVSDWVEIYNPAPNSVDLSDMSLSDDLLTPRRWVFPSGVTMPSGTYLLIKFDNTNAPSLTNVPFLNTGFGLDADGDQLFLFDAPASGGALVSSVTFGVQPPDFSIGRVPNGGANWALNIPTPGAPNIASSLGNPAFLRVNEWMASPASGNDWFEIYNPDGQPVNLSGLYLTDDLNNRTQYRIPALSFIGARINGYVQFHADNDPAKGANHTNFKLAAGGESIGIFTAAQTLIDGITFGQQQTGISEGRFPDGSANITTFPDTDTPGASNLRQLFDVVINEVLTHTDPPFDDAIELFNPTSASIDISGWYLSDNKGDPFRFRIPNGTVIASGGFVVFYESQFNPDQGRPPSFALSSAHGDDVYLFPTDAAGNLTGYRTGVKFGAAQNAVSFGRYDTSVKTDFTALSQRTLGADNPASPAEFHTGTGLPNAYPKVGPIVINEIQYHPPDIISGGTTNDNALDEFIELQNITTTNVPLYDVAFPTNKWRLRDAVDFTFPDGFSIAPGAFVLVVNFDPQTNATQLAAFQSKYSVPGGVQILGPYGGKLDNGGENVELVKPDVPQPPGLSDAGFVPSILVDKVEYKDSSPWPKLADGAGNSLQRRAAAQYGNDPVNWFAGAPTAGANNGAPVSAVPAITSLTLSHSSPVGVSDTFIVAASGTAPLSYQWYFNAAPIAQATNASFTLGNVQATTAGNYSVLVGNSAGAASGTLRLDVQLPPVITTQPQSQVAPQGGSAVFSVAVRGSVPLSYQWRKDRSPINGATGAVLRLTNVQSSDEGTYSVVITNLYGTATSDAAALSLNASPAIVTQPQSTSVFVGGTAVFSVVANGSQPLRYQWRFGTANIAGATNSTLTINNAQQSNAGNYTVLVTNAIGSILSAPANLTVSVPPVVSVTATDSSAGEPGSNTGTFTITRVNSVALPLTVYFSLSGTASPDQDYASLASPVTLTAGSASTNLVVTVIDDSSPEPNETVVLTLIARPEYVLGSPTSATVNIADDDNQAPSVTVTNPISGDLFNAGDNILLGAQASDADGSVAKVEFFYDNTNKIGQALSTPFRLIWTNAVAGAHAITAVATDNFGKAGISLPVSITVNAFPLISISSPANGATFFAPANILISASASDPDGSIVEIDFYAGTNFLGAVAPPSSSVTWSNVDVGTYSLSARATDNRGAISTSPAINISVTVPTPSFSDMFAQRGIVAGYTNFITGDNSIYTREPGEPIHDGKTSTHSAWLSWIAPVSGTCTMDTLGSSFDTILAIYTNNPPSNQTVNNLVRVTSNDDLDDSRFQSLVTFQAIAGVAYQIAVDGLGTGPGSFGTIAFHMNLVNPLPVIATPPQSLIVNPGATATFTVGATGPAPLRYQWRFNNTTLNGQTNTSLVLNNVSAVNQGNYFALVSNNSGSVTSSPASLTLRVAPTITLAVQSQIVDPGNNATFVVGASGTAPMAYQWRFNGANLSGATASSLLRTNLQHTNGGIYSVLVSNGAGQATSQAELFVRPSFFSPPTLSNGVLRLTISGTPGKRYSIDGSTNIVNWTPLGNVTNTAVQSQFQDSTSPALNRVYRARLLVP